VKLRFRPALAVVVLLLAACQPQARRALVLDLSLSDPTQLEGMARPWHDAGYAVEYRRYYPHLTRSDLARYHALLLLLGGEPETPSDALTAGDLALLTEWVRGGGGEGGGGVVVLGYAADGEGSLDRWTANRWLASQGAGITIGDWVLEDTTARPAYPRAQPWAEGRRVGDEPLGSAYDPFPLDRNHELGVARISQVLAVASRHAFVRAPKNPTPRPAAPIAAATRIGDGLVVVMSRHALGALGPGGRPTTMPLLQLNALGGTHDFLAALARWTRRPAEWAHVPPAEHGAPLMLGGAPLPVELEPPPLEPPAGVSTDELALPIKRKATRASGVPNWIRQLGIRALWTPLLLAQQGRNVARSVAAFDSLVGFLDEAGLNLLAGDAHPEAVADSLHRPSEEREAVRHAWSDAVNLLQPTSVAWIPAFGYGDYRPGRWTDSSRGPRGEALDAPCALDSLFWDSGLVPAFAALARVAGQARQLVPALAFDLSSSRRGGEPAGYSMGQEFCDAAWRQALTRLGRHGPLDSVPVAARYRTLREAGLLPLYFGALEELMAQRARALRDRALKESPNLYFAFRLQHAPGDWFTLGLFRGFSLPDRPLLLFTPELETRDLLAAYRARGLNAVHATELPLTLVRPGTLAGLKHVVFGENDGFWLSSGEGTPARLRSDAGRLTNDSLAPLLRRLAR
jgi:hypothetical protein